MLNEKKLAVIYCRVSTKEQVEEGNSLVTQEKMCREYALKHGYEITGAFIEQGESAKTANRTELQRLLNFCAFNKKRIQAVITYKIDRISRNTDDYSSIRILLKKHGVEIKSTSEHFSNDPAGRFMENIIANVAQFDNDVRTERSVNGMKEAMREGRYVWRAPLGYSNGRIDGKATIVANHFAPLVLEAFKKISQRIKILEDVRKEMALQGLTMPNGKNLSKSQFYRMLKNKVYAGWILKFGESHKGLFQPIVSDDLFDQVQLVLKYKTRRSHGYKIKHPDFPLRRFIQHPSGKKLTGCWSKGKNKYYPYYFFRSEKLIFGKNHMEAIFKLLLNQYRLKESHFELFKKQVQEHLVKSNKDSHEKTIELRTRVENLRTKQTQLIQKNLQGVISDYVLKEQLILIDQELLNANSSLASLPDTMIYYDELLDTIAEFLKYPAATWEKLPFEYKVRLQWFYFPKGIIFNGVKSQTQEICKIFNAKTLFLPCKSHKADLKHQKSNTPEVTTSENTDARQAFWQELGEEIITLAKIKEEFADPTG